MMPTGTLIYNPSAGRYPAQPMIRRATKVLSAGGWRIRVAETKDSSDLRRLAKEAVEGEQDVVFVAGGDGSVGQVASVLAGSQTALAVLPSGTANVWAQELGLPHLDWIHWFALEDAASKLTQGISREADLGLANDEEFLLWAGIGLDAEIMRNAKPQARWEKALALTRYAMQALWSAIGWRGIDLRLISSETEIEGKFLVAIASNIRAYAGGLVELAKDAKVDDGKLDFWLFEGSSVMDVIYHVVNVLQGGYVSAPGVHHVQTRAATIEASGELGMQIDGEPRRISSPVQFRVRERALRVLVPSGRGIKLFGEEGA
jgi:YegS/Rv2252/BmrU family lipid kinase